jgi:hypothetical protein
MIKSRAAPATKAAGTVQINRGKSLSLQARSIARPANIGVQTGSLYVQMA